MSRMLDKLSKGDLRSIGKADEVLWEILNEPALFGEVFYGMKHQDPVVRMRSADVIEKVSKLHPEYLNPYKNQLIGEIAEIEQQQVRWHVALLFTYLELTESETAAVVKMLLTWLEISRSRIVKVNCLQALTQISLTEKKYRKKVLAILDAVMDTGSPAMVARAGKLIGELKAAEE